MAEQPVSLDETIAENAASPKRAQSEIGSVEQHSIKDQIEADKYLASKSAVKRRNRGLQISSLAPPGASELS